MSGIEDELLMWLGVDYMKPAKTSAFGPYSSFNDVRFWMRQKMYEIGDEHPFNKLSREEIDTIMSNVETLQLGQGTGIPCFDKKGKRFFTMFLSFDIILEVANRLHMRDKYPTSKLYRTQMTRWWPDYKLSADTSLKNEIRKRLDPDAIRLLRDDAFQTFLSEENLAAKAKSFVKGESGA
jgi:hypothetical protein